MPDTTEEKQTLRSILCNALHVIEESRRLLDGVRVAKRADILRNMERIEMQISSNQLMVDTLNSLVDSIEIRRKFTGKEEPAFELPPHNSGGRRAMRSFYSRLWGSFPDVFPSPPHS